MLSQGRIVVIFNAVIGTKYVNYCKEKEELWINKILASNLPTRQDFCYFSPLISISFMGFEDALFFLRTYWIFLDIWVEVIMPSKLQWIIYK